MMRRICIAVSVAVLVASCAACPGASVKATQVIVDCTRQHSADIDALAAQLEPLLSGSKPDWSAVIAAAISAGRDIGGCAFAELVDRYLASLWVATPMAASVSEAVAAGARAANEIEARAQFERYRSAFASGATFRTSSGDR